MKLYKNLKTIMLDARSSYFKTRQLNQWALAALYAGSIAAILIIMQPYLFGYRLSGDDVWYLRLAIEGWESIKDNTIVVAKDQGRIGQFMVLPLNAFGAWLAGELMGRIIILALYIFQFLLFASYVSLLVRLDMRLFLLLLLVSLHPLVLAFLPPFAYPLLNTVPFILILLSRIAIVRARDGEVSRPFYIGMMQLVFVIGMTFSEFAIAFGFSVRAAEYLARIEWSYALSHQWRSAFKEAFEGRAVMADGLAVLAVMAPYMLFRWWYPSMYDGNTAGGSIAWDILPKQCMGMSASERHFIN